MKCGKESHPAAEVADRFFSFFAIPATRIGKGCFEGLFRQKLPDLATGASVELPGGVFSDRQENE
jgi:hypothetical protein